MTGVYHNFSKLLNKYSKKETKDIKHQLNLKSFENNKKVVWSGTFNNRNFYYCSIGSKRIGSILYPEKEYKDNFTQLNIRKRSMEEIGQFDIDGSAVLMVFEDENFKFINKNRKVKLGDTIGEFYTK